MLRSLISLALFASSTLAGYWAFTPKGLCFVRSPGDTAWRSWLYVDSSSVSATARLSRNSDSLGGHAAAAYPRLAAANVFTGSPQTMPRCSIATAAGAATNPFVVLDSQNTATVVITPEGNIQNQTTSMTAKRGFYTLSGTKKILNYQGLDVGGKSYAFFGTNRTWGKGAWDSIGWYGNRPGGDFQVTDNVFQFYVWSANSMAQHEIMRCGSLTNANKVGWLKLGANITTDAAARLDVNGSVQVDTNLNVNGWTHTVGTDSAAAQKGLAVIGSDSVKTSGKFIFGGVAIDSNQYINDTLYWWKAGKRGVMGVFATP